MHMPLLHPIHNHPYIRPGIRHATAHSVRYLHFKYTAPLPSTVGMHCPTIPRHIFDIWVELKPKLNGDSKKKLPL